MAATWAVLLLLLILTSLFGRMSSSDLRMLVLFAAIGAWYGYDAAIRMPRYRRALVALGQDEAAWSATHPESRNNEASGRFA